MEALKTMEARYPIEFTVPAFGAGSFYIQEDLREEFYTHYHRHKEIQISYILKGRGSVVIGNLIQPFFENEIYILKANDPHIFIKEGAENDQIHVVHIFVAFDKMQSFFNMQELHRIRDIFTTLDSSKKLLQKYSLPVRSIFQSLLREWILRLS